MLFLFLILVGVVAFAVAAKVAAASGCPRVHRVNAAEEVPDDLHGVVGVTAGASAPETLIEALVAAIAARFDAEIIEDGGARETVTFKLPRALVEA